MKIQEVRCSGQCSICRLSALCYIHSSYPCLSPIPDVYMYYQAPSPSLTVYSVHPSVCFRIMSVYFHDSLHLLTKCLCGGSVQACQCVACAGEGITFWWARRTVRFLRWWCMIAPNPSSSCRVTVRASCGPWRFILPNLSP